MDQKIIKAKTISKEYEIAMEEHIKEERSKPKIETAVDKLVHSYVKKLLNKEITLDIKFKDNKDVDDYIDMIRVFGRYSTGIDFFTLMTQEITKIMTEMKEKSHDNSDKEIYETALGKLYHQLYINTGMERYLGHMDINEILYHLASRFLEVESQLLSSFHPNYYMIHNMLKDIFTYYDDCNLWYYKNINPSQKLEYLIKEYRKYYHLDEKEKKE